MVPKRTWLICGRTSPIDYLRDHILAQAEPSKGGHRLEEATLQPREAVPRQVEHLQRREAIEDARRDEVQLVGGEIQRQQLRVLRKCVWQQPRDLIP